MKILITTDWYKPAINGVVTSVNSLTSGLTALGMDVRILTLSNDRHSHTEGNVTYIGSIGVGKIYPDARLKTAPSNKYIQEIILWHPDIVHSQCEFSTFFLARKIAETCLCPLVHTYHTVYEDFTHYFSPNIRFGKYMAATLSKKILSKTNLVIAPTCKVEKMLQRYGISTHISVIPSGLNLEQFKTSINKKEIIKLRETLGIKKDSVVLLYLGRLAKEKNIDEILTLFANQHNPKLILLIIGDGPYRKTLEEKAQKIQFPERVIFTGKIPPEEAPRYYLLGDIFISASQSETQGLTYIEAMASGLPLLCRKDACLSEVINDGKNGLLYANKQEFSTKLQKLLDNNDYRRALSKAAKQTADLNFSSTNFAMRVLQEYQTLLIPESIGVVHAI